jgi:hypothetical protein
MPPLLAALVAPPTDSCDSRPSVLIPMGRRQKGRDQWRRLGFEEGRGKRERRGHRSG